MAFARSRLRRRCRGDPCADGRGRGVLILSPVLIHTEALTDGPRELSTVTPRVTVTVLGMVRADAADRLGSAASDLRRAHNAFARTVAEAIDTLGGCRETAELLGVSHETARRWAAGEIAHTSLATVLDRLIEARRLRAVTHRP